jgi:hypothetical protein
MSLSRPIYSGNRVISQTLSAAFAMTFTAGNQWRPSAPLKSWENTRYRTDGRSLIYFNRAIGKRQYCVLMPIVTCPSAIVAVIRSCNCSNYPMEITK